ncbi:MAG: hypothetical protein H7061_07370 [Bdellovibrionaceae bacterium]|nr:hypothetical protein [Bdellovibrio sp.]
MSNSSGSNKNLKKPKRAPKGTSAAAGASSKDGAIDPANKSKRWTFIQNDLESALEAWDELEKSQTVLSPEEEQFEKIKTIIGQLKDKLSQF